MTREARPSRAPSRGWLKKTGPLSDVTIRPRTRSGTCSVTTIWLWYGSIAASSGKSSRVKALVATITRRAVIVPRSVATRWAFAPFNSMRNTFVRVNNKTPERSALSSSPQTNLNGWYVPSPGINRPRNDASIPNSCRILPRDHISMRWPCCAASDTSSQIPCSSLSSVARCSHPRRKIASNPLTQNGLLQNISIAKRQA